MPTFEVTTYVRASREGTFDLLRPAQFPEWRASITQVEPVDGPLDRPGARFVTRYASRVMPGSSHEITAIDPPRLLQLRGEAEGARYRATFRLDDAGEGTNVRFENEYEVVGVVGRLLRRRIAASLEREWTEDLERLKAVAERRP